jgi:hypothetical protein
MKKILITGMNKNQCTKDYFLTQQLQVVPSHYSLIRCLEDMNYEVEQRPVMLGEDLSSYHEVIVYIHSIQAFCQFLWSGLYAINARPDCIVAFDDWQFNQIMYSFKQYRKDLVEKPEKVFRQYLFELWQGKEDKETVMKYNQNYIDACDLILKKENRILVSAFARGDIDLLDLGWEKDKIYTYNPNPYHLNRNFENNYSKEANIFLFFDGVDRVLPSEKLREWNFASLVQMKTREWVKTQDVKWKINYYGAKRGEFKCERKTEPDMCRVFEEQWGCLMPGYFHSGGEYSAGWWRARPLQVADAGSILIAEKGDMNVYYRDSYLASLKASDIESMDLTQLTQTAAAQKEAIYYNHPLDKSVQREELQKILAANKH